jgi:hypothetical protein
LEFGQLRFRPNSTKAAGRVKFSSGILASDVRPSLILISAKKPSQSKIDQIQSLFITAESLSDGR